MAMLNNQRVHHGVNINPLQQSMEHLPFRSMMFRKKNSSLQRFPRSPHLIEGKKPVFHGFSMFWWCVAFELSTLKGITLPILWQPGLSESSNHKDPTIFGLNC